MSTVATFLSSISICYCYDKTDFYDYYDYSLVFSVIIKLLLSNNYDYELLLLMLFVMIAMLCLWF